MGSRQRKLPVTPLGRFVRGRRPDRNPLRRASDRAETAVLALLVIAFAVGMPFAALGAGSWAHALAHRAQLAELASRTQVAAVTLTTAPSQGTANGLDAQVLARWTAPDGSVATGEVPVPPGSKAGVTVPVWTTRDGQLTGPPLLDSQVSGDTILGGIGGAIAVAVTLTLAWALVRRLLDRRRMAAWDAEWQSTGPRWTTRA
jgi:hypothetical protein